MEAAAVVGITSDKKIAKVTLLEVRDEPGLAAAIFRDLAPQLDGASLVVSGGFERPPMERSEGVARLYGYASDVAAALGHRIDEGGTGGGSDGNFTAALGVPTLDGLGAVGGGAHALHEHVEIDSLVPHTGLLAGLIARILTA